MVLNSATDSVGFHTKRRQTSQRLAAQAQIKPKNWLFMGPASDNFSVEQLVAVGGAGSMTFMWKISLGELKDASENDRILRDGSLHAVEAANQIADF